MGRNASFLQSELLVGIYFSHHFHELNDGLAPLGAADVDAAASATTGEAAVRAVETGWRPRPYRRVIACHKDITSSKKLLVAPGITTTNKKLLVTRALLLVTRALLLVARSY